MFKFKKKYKLPSFPDNAATLFKTLCGVIEEDSLPELHEAIDEYVEIARQEDKKEIQINVDLAVEIAQRLHMMLDNYHKVEDKQRALIVGAVRYFVDSADGVSDLNFGTGFHDDAAVVNYVLQQIGIEGNYIDLRR